MTDNLSDKVLDVIIKNVNTKKFFQYECPGTVFDCRHQVEYKGRLYCSVEIKREYKPKNE